MLTLTVISGLAGSSYLSSKIIRFLSAGPPATGLDFKVILYSIPQKSGSTVHVEAKLESSYLSEPIVKTSSVGLNEVV